MNSGAGGDLAEEGEHADATVLDLDVAKAFKALLIGIFEEAERVCRAEKGPEQTKKRDVRSHRNTSMGQIHDIVGRVCAKRGKATFLHLP